MTKSHHEPRKHAATRQWAKFASRPLCGRGPVTTLACKDVRPQNIKAAASGIMSSCACCYTASRNQQDARFLKSPRCLSVGHRQYCTITSLRPKSAESNLAPCLHQRGVSAPIRPEPYCILKPYYTTPVRMRLYGHPG